jgi:GAF domain-containing protein
MITVLKERNETAAREEAIRARIDLGTALITAGQPLVAALGDVASTDTPEDARAKVMVLLHSAVSLARSETGRWQHCRMRAAFYRFDGDDRLVREVYRGYAASHAPRQDFLQGRSAHDTDVIQVARGENARLVPDLENHPPDNFIDYRDRCYKSFVSVPVRAGNKSFGLLTADADRPFALTALDEGYLILIAGAMGSGLAHLAAIEANSTNSLKAKA